MGMSLSTSIIPKKSPSKKLPSKNSSDTDEDIKINFEQTHTGVISKPLHAANYFNEERLPTVLDVFGQFHQGKILSLKKRDIVDYIEFRLHFYCIPGVYDPYMERLYEVYVDTVLSND
jgi:hypothetical protein